MKISVRLRTGAIAIFLLCGASTMSKAQDPASVTSPYIKDAQDAIVIRNLILPLYFKQKLVWAVRIEKVEDEDLPNTVTRLQNRDSLLAFVNDYLEEERRASNLRTDDVDQFGNRPNEDPNKKDGKPPIGPLNPKKDNQPKGPYIEGVEIMENEGAANEIPLYDEATELIHELEAILLVTDEDAVRRGLLQHFPNFPSTFPRAGKILNVLQRKASFIPSIAQQAGPAPMAAALGFNESNIIYGITDWAIKTAKRQMLEAVLDNYYEKLNANKISQTLLAHTLKTYAQFKEDNSVNLAKYGDLWKASFQEDLRNVPVHFQDEVFVDAVIEFTAPGWTAKRQVVSLISGSTAIVYGISQKKHPVEIIEELGTKYVTAASSVRDNLPLFERAVLLANVLSRVAGKLDNGIYQTISLKDLRDLSLHEWTTFLGLTYARNREELTLCLGKDPVDFVREIKGGPQAVYYNLLVSAITGYAAMRELLASPIVANADVERKKLSAEELSKVMKLAGEFIKTTLPYIFNKTGLNSNAIVKIIDENWDPVCQAISQIGEGVSSKEYGSVLDGALQVLVRCNKVFADLAGKKPVMDKVLIAFTRYGSLMVNILSAKTPDAVEKALDEMIPKDQYKLKNKTKWSISLSLYPGAFAGNEWIKKRDPNSITLPPATFSSKESSLSFYLPIGIDLSWGTGESAWILFAQAVDLGAVLNYRLTGDESTEQSNPNISFRQLLSPGISIMHQFKNTPLVFGAGVNYTPSLRKVQDVKQTYDANAVRAGIFLAVDITALHFGLSKKK